MTAFVWKDGLPPDSMRITQVYGIIFSRDGGIVLRVDGDKYSLAGGKPEGQDTSIESTLLRELDEEICVSADRLSILGYQEVDEEDGSPVYAQLRLVGLLKNVGRLRRDPDTGRTYRRLIVSYERAIFLLNWGDVGRLQILAAVDYARSQGWRVSDVVYERWL